MKLFFHFPPNNDMMDTSSIKRKGKMPLFWHFMAAEKTENWMLHRKVSTTMNFIVPAGYTPDIDLKETQIAIKVVKDFFQKELTKQLNLTRVSAPLFVTPESGLNDNLNGVERPVAFDIPAVHSTAQVVHSLAKWKRLALHEYDFFPGNGLVADMNAIRRDEALDNLHSIYVDQWDWEKVIVREDRTQAYLEKTVQDIVHAVCGTLDEVKWQFPQLSVQLERSVTFVTSQQLEDRWPGMTPKQRENAICRECRTVFIGQIGAPLASGTPHDGRAPDYDDWQLNGDILFWHEPLGCAMEISSMGIRVDAESLAAQLKAAGCEARAQLAFHKALLEGKLPLTIGGGIGQCVSWSLMADAMDYEEWKFGTRNEGTTYALHSFFRKLAQGIGPSLGLMAATWLGYNAALGANQTIEVATNMRYLTAGAYLLSAVLQLIAYGVIYNLDKKTLAQMEKDLGKRRDDAKADLSKIIGGED